MFLSRSKTAHWRRLILLGLGLLLLPRLGQAHVLDVDLSKLSRTDIVLTYLQVGFTHILPLGLDHILFVVSLYLLEPRVRAVLWQATAFTVAHSITLGLAMYGLISPPAAIVEPVIALSILFVALENIIADRLHSWRLAIVFGFGLIHGMGFASALTSVGLPRTSFLESLIAFNVGVELGQVAVILLLYLLVGRWFATKPWYKQRIVIPASVAIGLIASYWTVARIFFPV
jgi:hydrogenase/urease accessory protein HupE